MEISNYIIFAIALFVLFDIAIVVMILNKRKRFPEHAKRAIIAHVRDIQSMDEKHQIMEYDKVLDQCLKALNIKGNTLGERMKNYSFFKNTNAVWEAHKLRNKLAHEMGFAPTKKQFSSAKTAFEREIKSIIH